MFLMLLVLLDQAANRNRSREKNIDQKRRSKAQHFPERKTFKGVSSSSPSSFGGEFEGWLDLCPREGGVDPSEVDIYGTYHTTLQPGRSKLCHSLLKRSL